MFDFNVQRVLHFSQSLHRFTGIEKRIAFERGKEGKRKGEGEQARQLNRAQVSGSCMQSHSAKTPSMCELCHTSNAPTFLSGASIRAGRRELPGVSAGIAWRCRLHSQHASFLSSKTQEQSLPTTQRKEKVQIFCKAALLAQGIMELLICQAAR